MIECFFYQFTFLIFQIIDCCLWSFLMTTWLAFKYGIICLSNEFCILQDVQIRSSKHENIFCSCFFVGFGALEVLVSSNLRLSAAFLDIQSCDYFSMHIYNWFSLDQNNCIIHLQMNIQMSKDLLVFLWKFSVCEKHIIICSNNPV